MAAAGCVWILADVGCRCPNADVAWNAAVANRSTSYASNYCRLELFERSAVRAAAATVHCSNIGIGFHGTILVCSNVQR
jgi:hypothetical protein